jgi:hypothetical protein
MKRAQKEKEWEERLVESDKIRLPTMAFSLECAAERERERERERDQPLWQHEKKPD